MSEIPSDLKFACPICSGSGQIKRVGFASAGDMDANYQPRMITQSCHTCHGKGWLLKSSEDLVEEIVRLRAISTGKDKTE